MRFCMVTTFYPPYHFGGDGVFVHQLSNELAARGHQVEVIHCRDAYDLLATQPPPAPFPEHGNVTVHGLESRLGALSALVTHQAGRPLVHRSRLRELLERPFDVIHYHNVSLVGGPGILRYGDAVKLYTLHEYWLVCPTHTLFKFNRKPCLARHCLPCVLAHRRPPQLWRYTNMLEEATKHVDVFIAPSEFSRTKHLEMGLRGTIVEIPYFCSRWEDTALPPGAPATPGSAVPYFLFVGRLEKLKGLQTLIPVFRRYDKAQLLVVGVGGYEAELRKMAGPCPNVRFLGFQSGEQLRALYQQAVATIVPSVWYEVFGLVILEAFATGTPVIVSNTGGMPRVVRDSGGGFVFDTEEELVHAMDRLLEEPGLRAALGGRGQEALRQRWCAEVHVRHYLELIDRVATARRAGCRRHPG